MIILINVSFVIKKKYYLDASSITLVMINNVNFVKIAFQIILIKYTNVNLIIHVNSVINKI